MAPGSCQAGWGLARQDDHQIRHGQSHSPSRGLDAKKSVERTVVKILMIAPQPFFQPRGTPFSILHRLGALTALGHEVDLVTYPLGEDRRLEGVRILRAPGVPGIREVKVGPSVAKIPLDLMVGLTVLKRFRPSRYDVLHTHEEACYLGAILSRLTGVPHIYDMHSSLPQQLQNYGFLAYRPILWFGRVLERLVIRNSRAIIAICDSLRDIALERGADPRGLFLIHNRPVDDGETPTAREVAAFVQRLEKEMGVRLAGREVALYTGTFARNQGLELLLEASSQVQKHRKLATLVLVGGTEEQVARLRGKAKELGLAEGVAVLGRRPVEEMALWMAAATLLLSPRTHGTNTPLKIYSYLAAGKAILATDLPTHRQVLDKSFSMLVEPTASGLAQGLSSLLEDAPLRRKLVDEARKVAEDRYSPKRYLERHVAVLERVGR